ncbi:hypothetical protein [Enterococcus sp. 2201sp1_2201st1_B8_2201SCRN_220225]|uniref:SpaA isopeptide-forming pilin-related protein n=1 Tax=unclassified Enterococcus TaxID=2608891 RepID=UPI0034A3A17C
MKIRNCFIRIALLILLLVSYLSTVLPFCFAEADTIKEELLLSSEGLTITSFQEINHGNKLITWFFRYVSQAPEGSQQVLKMHISNQNSQIHDSQTNWHRETETGWWEQDDFSTDGQGIVQLTTPATENSLIVSFQMDRIVSVDESQLVEKNVLNEAGGPYELVVKTNTTSKTRENSVSENNEMSTKTNLQTAVIEELPKSESVVFGEQFEKIASNQLTTDPFAYTVIDDHSRFPTHNTQQFLGGGLVENEYIKNYDYSRKSESDLIDRYTLANSAYSGFDTGYHEFDSGIHTKKSVKLLEDNPKRFQVTLDTIGDEVESTPLDIVLLLDRSANMQTQENDQSYWKQLKVKVREFVESMMNTGLDVHVGIVDFFVESEEEPTVNLTIMNHRPMKDELKGNIENYTHDDFFSNNTKRILDRTVLSANPAESLGTPTFLAIDAALYLLNRPETSSNRKNAAKIVCSITNGSPNLAPTMDYYEQNGALLSVVESLKKLSFNPELSSYKSLHIEESNRFIGNGQVSTSEEMEATQDFLEIRKNQNPNVKWYSFGFHENEQSDALVASLGSEGCYVMGEIPHVVDSIAQEAKTTTIQKANLQVPMSPFISLHQESVSITPVLIDEENILFTDIQIPEFNFQPVVKDEEILLENISLGKVPQGRLGFRLTYEISLKEAYQDGKFYPTSKPTCLINNRAGPNEERYYYPIPAIRDTKLSQVNLELKLQIKDTNSGLSKAQFGIFQELQAEEPLYESNISTEEGYFSFVDVRPGIYWLKEVQSSELFKPLEPLPIQITNTGEIYVAKTPLLVIEKELKPVCLKVENISGTKWLTGAQYLLYSKTSELSLSLIESINDKGIHELTGIKADSYQLLEKQSASGFQPVTSSDILGELEITPSGHISYQSQILEPVVSEKELLILLPPIENRLKPFLFTLLVQNKQMVAISGSEFALFEQDPALNNHAPIYASGISDQEGQVIFNGEGADLLQPGKVYFMKQVSAPRGYLRLNSIFKVMIDETGNVQLYYGNEKIPDGQYQLSLKQEEANHLQLRIQQTLVQTLPKTGGTGKQYSYLGLGVVALLVGCYYLSCLTDSK